MLAVRWLTLRSKSCLAHEEMVKIAFVYRWRPSSDMQGGDV